MWDVSSTISTVSTKGQGILAGLYFWHFGYFILKMAMLYSDHQRKESGNKMARLTIYREKSNDTTAVSNIFLEEYMQDANDAQLKVYLYLIRMLNANLPTSVSDMADKFNHTEKDIMRALLYWESKNLLALDFDSNKNLVGISLKDLVPGKNAGALGENADSLSARQDKEAENSFGVGAKSFLTIPSAHYGEEDGKLAGACMAGNGMASQNVYNKPVYSPDQLREFKNRENTAQLLFITETYIGRPLTPAEMKSILFFTDELHFSDDLVDYLIQYCVDKGKKDFKYIEKVAINWAGQGITTPAQAQKLSTRYDRNVYAIMNQLGKSNSPTARELEYITRWTKEYGFTNDIIFEACERTVLATDNHRFEYADSILKSWHQQNVHHKADILRIDELYQQRCKNNARSNASTNKFNQFTQNDYDFEQLEKELLSN